MAITYHIDPAKHWLDVKVSGYHLSLRKEEAAAVEIDHAGGA